MASYEIEISSSAEKQLGRLPRKDQERIVQAILPLAQEPLPRGSRKLSGYEDVFRIRVGRYRILYSVSSRKLVIIIILKIGHRRDVYRQRALSELASPRGSALLYQVEIRDETHQPA